MLRYLKAVHQMKQILEDNDLVSPFGLVEISNTHAMFRS